MPELISRIAAHPYAALVALGAVICLLNAAGLSVRPVRPVAKEFMTRRETAMLSALERLLPHCRIHAQVAMGALLDAPPPLHRGRRASDRNAFSQKIVDFVAQDRATGAILALIEVDDRTHLRDRDRARDRMTSNAGYRTIRIPAHARPNVTEVAAALTPFLPTAVATRA